MRIKRLKEIIKDYDDDLEIFIRNSNNICETIGALEQIEETTYGFFGKEIPCIILNTEYSKELEMTEDEESFIDFVKTENKK